MFEFICIAEDSFLWNALLCGNHFGQFILGMIA
jgi:hypothetical protein